jgi:hypothetical protein
MGARQHKPMFERIDLDTGEELLDELSPHRWGRLWRFHRHDNDWIYRGHADASWDLTPSAFRAGGLYRLRWAEVDDPPGIEAARSGFDRRGIEHDHVLRFAAHADAAGFPLFGDSPALRNRSLTIDEYGSAGFPPEAFRGLYALAQHYGVPTRLLDWTRRGHVAAYFAAVDAAELESHPTKRRPGRSDKPPQRFAVWALSRRTLLASEPIGRRVELVTAAAAHVPNLLAQHGCFTLVRAAKLQNQVEKEHLPSLDRLLQENFSAETEQRRWLPVLYQFTVPSSEARKLLWWLSELGVSAMSVFPGLAGVYSTLAERTWYQIPPTPQRVVDEELAADRSLADLTDHGSDAPDE